MSHKVRVNAGQVQIALPDKNVYNGPIDVVLTDEQFAKIRPALFPSVLTDLGSLADPALDASFATDADLVAAMAGEAGKEIASSVLAASFTPTNTTQQDVTGWSVMVPANSGPVNISAVGGVLISHTTGTVVSTTSQRVSVYIVDELNTIVAVAQTTLYGTGVSQGLSYQVPLGVAVPNSAVDKTYRVQFTSQRQGQTGSTASIAAGGLWPPLTLQAIRR